MRALLLTNMNGLTQLVNMHLVSEAVQDQGSGTYTNLVIPCAVFDDARYIAVKETPEHIAKLLALG